MKNHRNIPFGYTVVRGQNALAPAEASAVQKIFTLYLAGKSYARIAEHMSGSGVAYHPASPWNKNMVKRILENESYTGKNEYPAIVAASTFKATQALRQSKTAGHAAPPEYLKFLRGRLVCANCGGPLKRDHRQKPAMWRCLNPQCEKHPSNEDDILAAITDCMKALRSTSLEPPDSRTENLDSQALFHTRNEIAREMGKLDVQEKLVRELLLKEAAEKYALCHDSSTAIRRMEKAIAESGNQPLDTAQLQGIFRKILPHPPGGFVFELLNGQQIIV